jgi:hypothetical protein
MAILDKGMAVTRLFNDPIIDASNTSGDKTPDLNFNNMEWNVPVTKNHNSTVLQNSEEIILDDSKDDPAIKTAFWLLVNNQTRKIVAFTEGTSEEDKQALIDCFLTEKSKLGVEVNL